MQTTVVVIGKALLYVLEEDERLLHLWLSCVQGDMGGANRKR